MAPSIDVLPSGFRDYYDPRSVHVTKKRKVQYGVPVREQEPILENGRIENQLEFQDGDATTGVQPHPLGIRPSGNVYDSKINLLNSCRSFACLPEELLLQILEFLDAKELLSLGATCKALSAYCASEELWKTLFVDSSPGDFSWRGSWRSTYLSLSTPQPPISCAGLFSDVLYLPFHRAHVPLLHYTRNIPTRNQISRISDLTPEEFNTDWASKPFILTNPVRTWPVFKKWSMDHLLSKYRDTVFRAEAVDWPFHTYVDYMRNNEAESPLYLFDCRFAEKMGLKVGDNISSILSEDQEADYSPPSCFSPDLFTALGPHRPDHRWLIIGPARSGSTFHADPNGTSAWNAVIRGSKYWLMFPPTADGSIPPELPGLHISPDGSHITAPLSIAEYLLSFHAAARNFPGCIEAVCEEGEVLHVPSGWYHMVLNIEDGIAITQNFVPPAHLPAVLAFLRDRRDQVSGFVDGGAGEKECEGKEYELFVEKLRERFPAELDEAIEELGRRDARKGRKTKWEQLTEKAEDTTAQVQGGFSFGFGFGDDEGEDDDNVDGEEVK